MIRMNRPTGNFLHKDDPTSLVIVRVNSHGKPDSVSYWRNPGKVINQNHEKDYAAGALMDIWV